MCIRDSYPGMNKVLQSAGRVIRTEKDRGLILLLDERFSTGRYRELFPREWSLSLIHICCGRECGRLATAVPAFVGKSRKTYYFCTVRSRRADGLSVRGVAQPG